MNLATIHQMTGNQFPFGEIKDTTLDIKKILVKKRICYKKRKQYELLKQKIDILKTISHRNTVNLRTVEQKQNGCIDLFYQYVPVLLEETFIESYTQTIKDLHKQFIELAIYLAKNYILTSFNPARCGVMTNQNNSIIKYYLPLNQIMITDNISALERSVQMFNLQSMHFLDNLFQSALNTTLNSSQKGSFGKEKLTPDIKFGRKLRKQSQQPTRFNFNSSRKLSVNVFNNQLRKLSTLSKQLSQFSEMRKQRVKESTKMSIDSQNSLKKLIKQQQERQYGTLKHYVSQQKIIKQKIFQINQRSKAALRTFFQIQSRLEQHKKLSILISKIKK